MKKITFLLSFLLILSSCSFYDDVEFIGAENFKMGKLETKQINFSVDLKLKNPNVYAISVKPSVVDVLIDENLVAKAYLDSKVKIKRKSQNIYSIPLHATLEDGALFKLMKIAFKEKVNLHFKGKVKGSVFGISKKIQIDETKEIEGSKLNFFNKHD